MADTIVEVLLKLGAAWTVTAIFFYLYMQERRRTVQLADKLYDLGIKMTQINAEFNSTLQNVEKDIIDIEKRVPRS